MALAIFAEAGVKDRLVHFDYNCILPQTDPGMGKDARCQRARCGGALRLRPGAVLRLPEIWTVRRQYRAGINESSADNPLWFILAGPMEVPSRHSKIRSGETAVRHLHLAQPLE